MLKDENTHLYPPYISAQVFLLPPFDKDLQNLRNVRGSHVAFVDRPAGGFDKMKVLAKCYDNEENCAIKLMNASQTGGKCGFCPGDAMMAIVKSGSSHLSKNETSLNKMSFNPQSTGSPLTTTGEKVTRIIKDPNYRRGSEVERPEDQKRPNNGTPAPGEGEDEETKRLRAQLSDVERERKAREQAGQSENERLKGELKEKLLSVQKTEARLKIEKFMEKKEVYQLFKTKKAWQDAVEQMINSLPYDSIDALTNRLRELEELWTLRANSMMITTRSASSQPDAGMRNVPKFGQQANGADSSIADVCIALAEALKRGIN